MKAKKLITLPAVLLCVMLFITGCGKNDCTECCDTSNSMQSIHPTLHIHPFEQFIGTAALERGVIYYHYLGGTPQRVQFFMAGTTDDICTNEHLTINYSVRTSGEETDKPIKIFGEVYWSAFSDEVIMWNDLTLTAKTYYGKLSDVGLKQAFPQGAATIDVYLTTEFESLGSFAGDTAFFTKHFSEFDVSFQYKKF